MERWQRLLENRFATYDPAVGAPFHSAWMAHAGEPHMVRLAHGIVAQWLGSRMVVAPHELIVGRLELSAIVSWTHREGVNLDYNLWQHAYDAANDTRRSELQAMRRAWEGRTTRHLLDSVLKPGERAVFGHQSSVAPGCHASPFLIRLASEGTAGLRQRVAASRAAHMDEPGTEPAEWYDALLILLDGIDRFAARYAETVRTAALLEPDPFRRDELNAIAARCERIVSRPAVSFADALQAYWFATILHGPDSPGRFDHDLGPWLERDLQRDAISRDEAQELVDCVWVKFAQHRCWSLTLSGQLPDGGDATNTLTYLALDSMRRLRTDAPNVSLRVHAGTPRPLLREACELLASGHTMPALVNDEPVIASMLDRGIAPGHARDYTLVGCTQVVSRGRCGGAYEDSVVNALKCFELALYDGVDPLTGQRMGPATGSAESFGSYGAFEAACLAQLDHMIRTTTSAINRQYAVVAQHYPDLFKSLLTEGCLESGRDYRHGGPLYVEGLADVLGITNLGDSLHVVDQLVFREGRITLPELADILMGDWAGHEPLRQECLHRVGKFGNDEPAVDAYTLHIFEHILRAYREQEVPYGRHYGIDVIGWVGSVIWGQGTGATPDGRRRGAAVSDSVGPSQGRDRHGVTAVLRSVSRLPHHKAHGILALNLRFGSETFDGPDGVDKMAMLSDAAFSLGLQQIQVNVVNADTLRAAQAQPEAYESLMVRIGGYSTYFNWLSREHQDDIIARTEHAL